jgi:hypothetical protein
MTETAKPHPSPLGAYATNVTSQSGEDGVLAEIFRRIGTTNRSCIEFGAWDGVRLSNTYDLWHNQSWRALLIEADKTRCEVLQAKTTANKAIVVLNAFVQAEGENRLDALIRKTGFTVEPDLLGIDIDGDDYYILRSLEECRPRVIVIEYNPTIPYHIDLVPAPGEYFGASAAALERLAGEKGYKLVFVTNTNCIFVRTDASQKLNVPDLSLAQLFPGNRLSYVISDYGGNCYLTSKPVYLQEVPRFALVRLLSTWLRSMVSGSRFGKAEVNPPVTPVRVFRNLDE